MHCSYCYVSIGMDSATPLRSAQNDNEVYSNIQEIIYCSGLTAVLKQPSPSFVVIYVLINYGMHHY